MTFPRMLTDQLGNPIQVLAPATTVKAAITASSARVALPTDSEVVRVAADGNCYIAFGNGSVVATANDILFPVGSEMFRVPAGATNIAVIQDGAATGSLVVTSMV